MLCYFLMLSKVVVFFVIDELIPKLGIFQKVIKAIRNDLFGRYETPQLTVFYPNLLCNVYFAIESFCLWFAIRVHLCTQFKSLQRCFQNSAPTLLEIWITYIMV